MPAWWKGGLKERLLKSISKSPPPPPEKKGEGMKEKAHSFDGVLTGRNGGESVSGGHPLPLPSASSPLPSPTTEGAAAGSGSTSSLSSSGSSDCPPDVGFYRSSAPVKTTRGRHVSPEPHRHQHSEGRRRFSCSPVVEHPRSCESPLSPTKEAQSSGQRFQNAIFNPRVVTLSSTTHQVSLRVRRGSPSGRQENLRSPPHPLPLPPTSPSPTSSSLASSSSHMQWKKGKLLGRGTFGHVYLGFNSESGQMCAIKEVKAISDDSISRESLKQLNQEINLLSQLSHPNVVQYYGSELVGETLSVYLEYVSGGSIHKLLQEYGPFGEPVIKNYTAQILSGLAYLHCRKTVHRDIKGANILVDPNGEVKLADFGMAKHISSYTSIKSFKGSPYWMAPEVIMNVSGYNLSVDIWSLGCTVLEMATSKPPWSQFEGVAAIFKIGNSKDIPDIPEHLSLEAKSFLRLCLLRDPSSRPTATQLMNHPFIYDQHAINATKSSTRKDRFPSSSDGSYSMNKEFHIHRSVSPLHEKEYGLGHQVAAPIAHKDSSDLMGMRMNMSLPVSRCTSPLRQFQQANKSCFPSPTHPAFSAGAVPSGPSNFSYRYDPSHNFPDPSFDVSDLGTQAQHQLPRR